MIRFTALNGRTFTIVKTPATERDYEYTKILYKTEPSFLACICTKLIPYAEQLEGMVHISTKDPANIDITWCNSLGEIMARTCTTKHIYSLFSAPVTPRIMADFMYMRGVFTRNVK